MKCIWGGLLALMVLTIPVWAESKKDPDLLAIDATATYHGTDFSAEYTVVQKKADQGESSLSLALFRRDDQDKYVLVLLKPDSDRGKGVLRIGESLWKYFPDSRRFEVTSAKDQLQNSNVRFSDFDASTLADDYEVIDRSKADLGQFKTTVLTLKATNDHVTFPKVVLWVTSDHLVRKRQDFSLSGQLLRTSAIPAYSKIGPRAVPKAIIILDELSGKTVNGRFINDRTLVTISKPAFERLSDLTFSQAYLEKLGR